MRRTENRLVVDLREFYETSRKKGASQPRQGWFARFFRPTVTVVESNPLPVEPQLKYQAVTINTAVNISCDPDYTQISSLQCEKVVFTPAKYGCPQGMKLGTDGLCKGIEYGEADYICPSGYTAKNGSCYQKFIEEKQAVCPEGYQLNNRKCEKKLFSEAYEYCMDTSWVVKSGYCQRNIYSEAIRRCQTDFLLNSLTNKCEKKTITDAETRCTADLQSGTSNCRFFCPVGTLKETKCELLDQAGVLEVCKTGFSMTLDNRCIGEETRPTEKRCRQSAVYSRESQQCESLVRTDPVTFCPTDYIPYDRNTKCFKEESIAPLTFCSGDFIAVGNVCQKERVAPCEYTCEQGTRIDPVKDAAGNDTGVFICQKLDTRSVLFTCPTGYILNKKKYLTLPTEACELVMLQPK